MAGLEGQCSPHPAGGDPDNECAGLTCDGLTGCVQLSCQAIHAAAPDAPDGVYLIDPDGLRGEVPFSAYCNMTDESGGWTLAMKIDGESATLNYDSPLWEDDNLHNSESIDVSSEENAKLQAWISVSFTDIMVGMRASDTSSEMAYRVLQFMEPVANLYDLFNDSLQPTSIGRNAWLSMVPGMEIRGNCDAEGVNLQPSSNSDRARVRLGILGNDEQNCDTPNSYAGLGGQIKLTANCPFDYSAGSVKCKSNPNKGTPAFAVMFVR